MANNQLVASDNWASGSLAAGWSALSSGFPQVVLGTPNVVETTLVGGNRYGCYWTGSPFSSDQISEVTINSATTDGGTSVGLYVRFGAVGGYYVCNLNMTGGGNYNITKNFGASMVTGNFTMAAGDVIAFEACGNCLSLYQNWNRLAYTYDTGGTNPLVGGSPGFDVIASNLTYMQIRSWRGYNAVQQDGVWKKQGIVIPALPADLPYGVANGSNIIYEGNSQLGLVGNVYKMWFSSWSSNSVGYAESTDGVNWTRRGSSVITAHIDPGVIKVGSTYYLYAFANTGTGALDAYTSTDGITWTSAATNIIPGLTYFFQPFTVQAGTWYALGGGTLYTSSNGLAWTSQATTFPVNVGAMSGGIVNVGANWYAYGQTFPVGGTPDGTETYRVRCTNPGTFTNWVLDAHSQHISQMYEAVNTFKGQSVPCGMIQVGNQTYFYSTQCPGDVSTPAIYQIALSIAPTTLANVVSFPEDGMPQGAADNFTGGPGSLPATWTIPASPPQIIAGPLVEGTVLNSSNVALYNAVPFTANQWSEITITNQVVGNYCLPVVRSAANFANWYECNLTGNTGSTATCTIKIRGVNNINLGPTVTVNLHVGDKFRLEIFDGFDGFPVLTLFQQGYCVLQVQDQTAAPLRTGLPGFYLYPQTVLTAAQISGWSGGNAAVLPYPTGPPPPSTSNLISLGLVIVTTAGTPVPVSATPLNCNAAYFTTVRASQSGQQMYVGVTGMNKSTLAGVMKVLEKPTATAADSFQMTPKKGKALIDLSRVYIDADTSGDGILVSALI
jgi:hypothetical protein